MKPGLVGYPYNARGQGQRRVKVDQKLDQKHLATA